VPHVSEEAEGRARDAAAFEAEEDGGAVEQGSPGEPLHLIQTPCMDLCPKGGVTVCLVQRNPLQLSVLRSEEDLARLVEIAPDSAV